MHSSASRETRQGAARKNNKSVPAFLQARCKQCGICTHFCPQSSLDTDEKGYPRLVDPSACTSCRICERLCPDFAIFMEDEGNG